MDLATRYLTFSLPHPLIAGASPLADDLDTVRRLEDAGVAAIVMRSLFEEQISREAVHALEHAEAHGESFAEATTFFPDFDQFALGPEEYFEQLRRIKAAVAVPVVASLNGTTEGGWLNHARLLEEAGADALELNVYYLATDPATSGEMLERRMLAMVRAVRGAVRLPLAVKLSPFYTSLAHVARRVVEAGADGLVLFNRFYQPDLDPEALEVTRALRLSDPSELPLRLRWLAILRGQSEVSLAASGGVHSGLDAIKAVMAGADAVQLVSLLLRRGPETLRLVRDEMERWLVEHDYDSLRTARGSLSLARCPDPAAYERANYMHILQTWRAPAGW